MSGRQPPPFECLRAFGVTAVTHWAGNVRERYLYDPYGRVTVLHGESGYDSDIGGEESEWDEDSDGTDWDNELLYCGYRYDPETGRPELQETWYGGSLANVERVLEACPGTVFIGHAPGFWREISDDAGTNPKVYPDEPWTGGGRLARLFDTCENLYADLSAGSGLGAFRRDPEKGREFIVRFADRLLFGRDYYGSDLLDFLETLDLPAEVREKLFLHNALKLVPL